MCSFQCIHLDGLILCPADTRIQLTACGVRPGQASLQGLPELLREVTVLGVYRHPHLVPLLCFSLSRRDGQQEACLVRDPACKRYLIEIRLEIDGYCVEIYDG